MGESEGINPFIPPFGHVPVHYTVTVHCRHEKTQAPLIVSRQLLSPSQISFGRRSADTVLMQPVEHTMPAHTARNSRLERDTFPRTSPHDDSSICRKSLTGINAEYGVSNVGRGHQHGP